MVFKYKFYIWLVDTLLTNKKGLTINDIQQKWNISSVNSDGNILTERTFHRYRHEAESLFNIDIICDRQNGGVYSIDSSENFENNTAAQWLLSAFRISNLADHLGQHKDVILEPAPPQAHQLRLIIDTIKKEVLNLIYKSHYKEAKNYVFIPVFIRLFKQRWYVIGEDIVNKRCLTLALERMSDIKVSGETHKLSKHAKGILNPNTYFEHCFGIIRQYEPITIRFRAFHPQNLYIADVPIHTSQTLLIKTDDYSDFEIFVRPTYDLKQEFLWNRDKLAVLYPESFRLDMINILQATLKGYETGDSFAIDE